MPFHREVLKEERAWTPQGLFVEVRKAFRSLLPSTDSLPINLPRRSSGAGTARRTLSASLPSPVPVVPSATTLRFVLLCGLWYASSALSSNTGKAIMNQFRYPVTLTFVQFGFVAGYCLLFMSPVVRFSRLRKPSRAIFKDTLPMGLFQVGGHIFSSMAISRIPVSTTHTIKALSPLFTVAAYALLFGVRYSAKTYLSLLPLTFGVMLACTFDMSASNIIGLLCAFGSALVFVSSNIFFKKIMPTNPSASSSHHKLDKLNLLFYSSSMAFLLMIPIWVFTDLPLFLAAAEAAPDHVTHPAKGHSAHHSVAYYMFLNGTVHYGQNIIAFIILASVSPVTYSIASLVKRVAVICMAIVWFNQSVHPVQAVGIAMTFVGLWMYNNAKGDVERGENRRRGVEARREGLLPSTRAEERILADAPPELPPVSVGVTSARAPPTPMQATPLSPLRTKQPPYPAYEPRGHYPNLHIDIVPQKGGVAVGPTDPYPSPPASLDEPPLTAKLTAVSVRG
ncbi:TPT-domain-containing protein [Artomyces pyxidatus]|uniref:TPT-domain-containing protein n=1 Tax=Artomyces pyxidatus TaxID=48021 RepID=A0ACB8SX59_9AGAM|nr:TPT-domain-containing protein [Artomyces pyxidatus]